jgi:alcohol dehydrogenase
MRCRSLFLVAPRQLTWVDEELSPPSGDCVLVRTRAGAVSVGSEVPQYTAAARTGAPPRYPRMTGYESVGTVIAAGPAVRQLRPGDRVVAFYGHRTHAIVREAKAIPVPDDIPDPLALLAILSCDAAKGVRKVRPEPHEPVLVAGAGVIGLLALFALKMRGVLAADIVEPLAERRELALRFGARRALAPDEMDAGGSDGYAAGFECSGRNAAFELLQSRLGHGGRLCVLSDGNLEPLVLTPAFHEKELTVVGSSDGWDYHQHAAWFFEVARGDADALLQLFSFRTTAGALVTTYARLADGAIAPIKVLVEYPELDES